MKVPNFQNGLGQWCKFAGVNGKSIQTESGSVWYDMHTRCNPKGSIQKRQPSYVGCTMSENFKNFQFFAEWHINQIGYGNLGYEIDKDTLVAGNKLYSENTCVLIPQELNMFLITENTKRGAYPSGVYLDKRRGTFQSRLSIAGSYKYLGAFETPGLAFKAFVLAKEAEARRWHKRLATGEFVVDPRVIERMRNWTFPEVAN